MARPLLQMALDALDFDVSTLENELRLKIPDIQIFEIGTPPDIRRAFMEVSHIPEVIPVSFTHRDKSDKSTSPTILTLIANMPVIDIAIPAKKKKHWEHLNKGSYKARK